MDAWPQAFRGSPWVNLRRAASPDLLITFSPVGVPEGKFVPYSSVDSVPWNILRVNAPNDSWYVGGIPETAHELGLFEATLDRFIAASGFRHVYLFGGSMGGFGALDFGLRIASDAILATGAETLMGHPNGFARWRASEESIMRARRRIEEWPGLAAGSGRRLHVIYGAASPIDVLFADQARKLLGVEPTMLRECEHSVPQFAQARGGFASFMVNMLTTGTDDLVTTYRIG